MNRLDNLRVTVNTSITIKRISHNGMLLNVASGERLIEAGTAIVADNPSAHTQLADELTQAELNMQAIRGCTSLGLIVKATSGATQAIASL